MGASLKHDATKNSVTVKLSGTPGVTVCVAFATHHAWIHGWGGGRASERDRTKCVQLDKKGDGETFARVLSNGDTPVLIANILILGELATTRAIKLPGGKD